MNSSPNNQKPTYGPWIILSLGLVGAFAFAVAHAPPGWQRPGPTAFWFAVAGGLIVGGIAVVNRITDRRLVFLVTFVVIAVSIAGMTGERYRLYVQSLKNLYLGPDAAQNPNVMRDTLSHGPGMQDLMNEFRQEREKVFEAKRSFSVFLTLRLEALGLQQEPWPFVFWCGEIVIGAVIGAFVAEGWHKSQWESQANAAAS